jgi:hypothetical protein
MTQAFASFVSPLAGAMTKTADFPAATSSNSAVLDKITILEANLEDERRSFGGPSLHLKAKNDTETTIATFEVRATVKSPDREVPWATSSDIYFNVPGGISKGETADMSGNDVMGTTTILQNAIKAHPDARLSIQVTDARGPDGQKISK